MAGETPGSPQAVEHGCTCPVIDNHHGKGQAGPDGPQFWINGECPLHGTHGFIVAPDDALALLRTVAES